MQRRTVRHIGIVALPFKLFIFVPQPSGGDATTPNPDAAASTTAASTTTAVAAIATPAAATAS